MGAIYRLTENEDRAIIWQADRQIRQVCPFLLFFIQEKIISTSYS